MNRQTFLAANPRMATDALDVRPFLADDVYDFYSYAADPVFRQVGGLRPMSGFNQAQVEVATYYNLHRMGRMLPLAIVKRDGGEMIGHVFLQHIDWQGRSAEILYGIHPDHWDRGHATAAVRAVVGYAFGELGLRTLVAHCHGDNVRSRRVLERTGFELGSAGVNGIDQFHIEAGGGGAFGVKWPVGLVVEGEGDFPGVGGGSLVRLHACLVWTGIRMGAWSGQGPGQHAGKKLTCLSVGDFWDHLEM